MLKMWKCWRCENVEDVRMLKMWKCWRCENVNNTSSPVPASSLPPSTRARCASILPIQRIIVARAETIWHGKKCIVKDCHGLLRIVRWGLLCLQHLLRFLPAVAESPFLACRTRCNRLKTLTSTQMLRTRTNSIKPLHRGKDKIIFR